jgi:hypothetical protein
MQVDASAPACIIYPNPSNGNIMVDMTFDRPVEVTTTVSDIMGRAVYHERSDFNQGETTVEMNLASIPSGIYVVSITSSENQRWTCRFVKQ